MSRCRWNSTTVTLQRLSLTTSSTHGGTTKTETRNIFGPAWTQTPTPASAESTEIASKLLPSATAIPLHQCNWSTMVRSPYIKLKSLIWIKFERIKCSGVITDKSVLPVTRLNFGRTQLASSSGVHTLGRFECTGRVAVGGMPTSCQDLWRMGHTLSGLYSVLGTKMVESVSCDFTKIPSDAGKISFLFKCLKLFRS